MRSPDGIVSGQVTMMSVFLSLLRSPTRKEPSSDDSVLGTMVGAAKRLLRTRLCGMSARTARRRTDGSGALSSKTSEPPEPCSPTRASESTLRLGECFVTTAAEPHSRQPKTDRSRRAIDARLA
jgi:hypothetical protein